MINKGWIKCSERLPIENGYYLCWCNDEHLSGFAQVLGWCDGWNCYKSIVTGKIIHDNEITNVVAWQPIEPYERG